jgi:hypothetical protein
MVASYAWHYCSRDQRIENENPSRNSFLDPLGIGNTLPQLNTNLFTVCTTPGRCNGEDSTSHCGQIILLV